MKKLIAAALGLPCLILLIFGAKNYLEESVYQARMERSMTISNICSYARISKEFFRDCEFPAAGEKYSFPKIFYMNGGLENWDGPYIIETPMEEKPLDTWGTPIQFIQQRQSLEIRSVGPDKKFGTSDDIAAIVEEKNGIVHSYWILPKSMSGIEI